MKEYDYSPIYEHEDEPIQRKKKDGKKKPDDVQVALSVIRKRQKLFREQAGYKDDYYQYTSFAPDLYACSISVVSGIPYVIHCIYSLYSMYSFNGKISARMNEIRVE